MYILFNGSGGLKIINEALGWHLFSFLNPILSLEIKNIVYASILEYVMMGWEILQPILKPFKIYGKGIGSLDT